MYNIPKNLNKYKKIKKVCQKGSENDIFMCIIIMRGKI